MAPLPPSTPSPVPDATDGRVADAPRLNWVDRRAPRQWRPYLRLARADRLIGAWLLLLPGWQSLALAGGAAEWTARELETYGWLQLAWLVAAFFIGAVIMRGAGCVLNDLVDRDIDAQVARTRSRPLPSGQATPLAAAALLVALCLAGLAILLTFNSFAIWVGLASALPIAVYPFMKRITWWPQAFLGVAFSWGALLGWASLQGDIGWPAVALYAASFFWVVGYDTIYAHQDIEDDALVGVRSTARLFGDDSVKLMAGCYGLSVLFAGLAGVLAGLSPWFWVGLAAFAAHLGGQLLRFRPGDAARSFALFYSNREAGLLLLAGIIAGGL